MRSEEEEELSHVQVGVALVAEGLHLGGLTVIRVVAGGGGAQLEEKREKIGWRRRRGKS